MKVTSLCWVLLAACGSTEAPTAPPPTIVSISPTSGAWGANLTITGTNFGSTQGNGRVLFPSPYGSTGFEVDMWMPMQITGRVAFPATGAVSVMTDGGVGTGSAFTAIGPTPSGPADATGLAEQLVLSSGTVAGLFTSYELTPEPTLVVFGSASQTLPLSALADPSAPLFAHLAEGSGAAPVVIGTRPDGEAAVFAVSGGTSSGVPIATGSATISGNVILAGSDAGGLVAWIETEDGLVRANEGSPWTATAPVVPAYPPIAGAGAGDGTLWLVETEDNGDGTSSLLVQTLSGTTLGSAETAGSGISGTILGAQIQLAGDGQALVTGTTDSAAIAPAYRSAAGAWSAAPAVTGLVQYAFVGGTLGALVDDATSKTTALVPDATDPSTSTEIPVWPAQSLGIAFGAASTAYPIVGLGSVAYALTWSTTN